MTPRERFQKTLNFEKPDDRLPMIEWAAWWDKTIDRWKQEGLPQELSHEQAIDYFGLDNLVNISAPGSWGVPNPASHGGAVITDEASYEELRPRIFSDATLEHAKAHARKIQERHNRGEISVRLWLDGFFWFPRVLLGIEPHMYAFYDYPELMHRMNGDLTEFGLRVIEEVFPILKPDMVGFAEDMSYNHGPMLSYALFKEFLLPYYQRLIPVIKSHGVKVLVDSDGDITTMLPWLLEAGLEGVYPLERQAGVDIAAIRKAYPRFLMLGGYDKMVMSQGREAMAAEFERLLPVMRSGGFIPSVDHQTPPGVSLAQYRDYLELFEEYCRRAAR